MKNIFSYNVDTRKNAYVNWRMDRGENQLKNKIKNMITIADGYMKSSLILARHALEDNIDKKADILIFPILCSANHAIELYLKSTVWTLNILLKNDEVFPKTHNIRQLLSIVKSRVNEYEHDRKKKNQFKEMIKNLDIYIEELFSKIEKGNYNTKKDNMDFSRYPFDSKLVPHFYIETFNNVVVDLENFINRFEEIEYNLSIIAEHYFYDHLLHKNDLNLMMLNKNTNDNKIF
ncbi:hypothetical protein [Fervidibacillus halotolerans]|uniref:HEPN domain-containing protein n=1 Tax=Fervidibacillus halotolerans TaxID=2980027 RepID=A0A9E8RXJ1_9BACI|nr:hypothetical protein [Fervidibacillus halotolerans]WAA12825.1 HEPN domain-containing protein [Fervidibacillus halotolerans]